MCTLCNDTLKIAAKIETSVLLVTWVVLNKIISLIVFCTKLSHVNLSSELNPKFPLFFTSVQLSKLSVSQLLVFPLALKCSYKLLKSVLEIQR